jgi:hypothetical protein
MCLHGHTLIITRYNRERLPSAFRGCWKAQTSMINMSASVYHHWQYYPSFLTDNIQLQRNWRGCDDDWCVNPVYETFSGRMLTFLSLAFGYQTSENDEFVRIAEEAQLAMVSSARPGQYLVDVLPILKHIPSWVPGAGFKRIAKAGYDLAQELQTKPWEWARKEYAEGRAKKSFFLDLMETKGATADSKELRFIQKDCAVLYASKWCFMIMQHEHEHGTDQYLLHS